jgi:hypothetical protein
VFLAIKDVVIEGLNNIIAEGDSFVVVFAFLNKDISTEWELKLFISEVHRLLNHILIRTFRIIKK